MWATPLRRCPSCPQPFCRCRRARPSSGCGSHAPGAGVDRCTTKFENTHRIVRREVLYRFHPWYGCQVFVHEVVNRSAACSTFRCTLDGSAIERYLEIPAWMFDRAACAGDERLAVYPFVNLETLNALSALLDQVLKIAVPSLHAQFPGACRSSHEQNRGESHDREYNGASHQETADKTSCRTVGSARKRGAHRVSELARSSKGDARVACRPDDEVDTGACAHGQVTCNR
jgi:hypothetical protein